jgi:hypothetical protein
MGGSMLHVDGNCCGSKKVEVSNNHPQGSSWMITKLGGQAGV